MSAHLWVGNILIEHNSIKNFAVLKHTTGDFFNLGVSLDINFNIFLSVLSVDSSYSFDSKVDDKVAPLAGELGTNCRVYNLAEIFVALEVNGFLNKKLNMAANYLHQSRL